jgi:hypothetical protein
MRRARLSTSRHAWLTHLAVVSIVSPFHGIPPTDGETK